MAADSTGRADATPSPEGLPTPHRVQVAEATAADTAELARMHLEAVRSIGSLPKAGPLVEELARGDDPGVVQTSFATTLARDSSQIFLGLLGDVAVGYGVLVPDGNRGRIRELWVEPAARCVGVGAALLDSLRAAAARAAMTGLDSVALPGDRNTKNFFEDHAMVARAIVVGTSEL